MSIYRGDRWGQRGRDPKRCAEAVWDNYSNHQCRRPGVVCREVDGVEYGFCRQHDPVAAEARRAARHNQWQAEWDRKERIRAYNDALQALRVSSLDAIRQIAAGHNDPRTLALEVLSKEPEPLK